MFFMQIAQTLLPHSPDKMLSQFLTTLFDLRRLFRNGLAAKESSPPKTGAGRRKYLKNCTGFAFGIIHLI
jgi:hypothetical protein